MRISRSQALASALAGVALLCCTATPAMALDGSTAAIAIKALNFVQPKPAKPMPVTIVVDSGQSAAGEAIKGDLGSAVTAKIVDSGGDLAGAVGVIIVGKADVTAGLSNGQLVIGDMDCMQAGRCALAVERQASGAAKYHVNTAALSKAGVSFDKNFQMLVTAH
jgi:hypothetical protein